MLHTAGGAKHWNCQQNRVLKKGRANRNSTLKIMTKLACFLGLLLGQQKRPKRPSLKHNPVKAKAECIKPKISSKKRARSIKSAGPTDSDRKALFASSPTAPGSPPKAAPGDDWSLPHPDSDSPADVPASARAAAEPAAAPPLEPADADKEDAPAQEVGKWTTEQITTLVQSKQDPKARPSWAAESPALPYPSFSHSVPLVFRCGSLCTLGMLFWIRRPQHCWGLCVCGNPVQKGSSEKAGGPSACLDRRPNEQGQGNALTSGGMLPDVPAYPWSPQKELLFRCFVLAKNGKCGALAQSVFRSPAFRRGSLS